MLCVSAIAASTTATCAHSYASWVKLNACIVCTEIANSECMCKCVRWIHPSTKSHAIDDYQVHGLSTQMNMDFFFSSCILYHSIQCNLLLFATLLALSNDSRILFNRCNERFMNAYRDTRRMMACAFFSSQISVYIFDDDVVVVVFYGCGWISWNIHNFWCSPNYLYDFILFALLT